MAPDPSERFKGGVHFVAGGIATAMCLHNLLRWVEDREWRNGLNAGVYAALVAFECVNTLGHCHDDAPGR